MPKKLISIITPVFNEEENVTKCCDEVRRIFDGLADRYDFEHIIADNCSDDGTLTLLRQIASKDKLVKIIVNSRNFGAEKSGFNALRDASGDAFIGLPCDLQEPPTMIPAFIAKWEEGFEVVYGIYENKSDGWVTKQLRRFYYYWLNKLSEEPLPQNNSGFGLYDRKVLNEILKVDDHSPYVRGIIACVGFRKTEVAYERVGRQRGESKHGWGFLVQFGLNALISYSLVPLRVATYMGILLSGLSVLMALAYALIKIFNWGFQAPGATTVVVIVLFFSGVQLFFLGMLGEYIGAIHAQVRRKPFVVVREKINFDE